MTTKEYTGKEKTIQHSRYFRKSNQRKKGFKALFYVFAYTIT